MAKLKKKTFSEIVSAATKFDEKTVTRIIERVNLPVQTNPTELADDLEEAANAFGFYRVTYDDPLSKTKLIEYFTKIEKSAHRLAKALGVLDDSGNQVDIRQSNLHLLSALDRQASRYAQSDSDGQIIAYIPADAVSRATEGSFRLYKWAQAGLKEMETYEKQGGATSEAWLICKKLPEIYERHFGQPFGYTTPTGENEGKPPDSAGLQFVMGSLAALGIEKSPEAIVKLYQRHPELRDTAPKN